MCQSYHGGRYGTATSLAKSTDTTRRVNAIGMSICMTDNFCTHQPIGVVLWSAYDSLNVRYMIRQEDVVGHGESQAAYCRKWLWRHGPKPRKSANPNVDSKQPSIGENCRRFLSFMNGVTIAGTAWTEHWCDGHVGHTVQRCHSTLMTRKTRSRQ